MMAGARADRRGAAGENDGAAEVIKGGKGIEWKWNRLCAHGMQREARKGVWW